MIEAAFLFLVMVVLISLSGVLMPGPNMAVVIGRGVGDRFAGARVSVGHAMVEVPLIVALFLGFDSLRNTDVITVIAILGGSLLIITGLQALRDRHQVLRVAASRGGSTVALGVITSVSNPYWWLWWATIGAALIASGTAFGTWMLPAFIIAHLGVDLVCLQGISMTMSATADRLDPGWLKWAAMVSGGIMLFFGAYFLSDGLLSLI